MNHIVPYKLFESQEDIILQNIKDICLDLVDEGYDVTEVNQYPFEYSLRITLAKGGFTIHDISDVVYRLIDYMNMNGYEPTVLKRLRTVHNITNKFKREKGFSKFNQQRMYQIFIGFKKPRKI